MEREMDQGSNVGRREPASWVPEEHVITECYPVFPTHIVDYPHIDGHWGAQLNLSYLVNKACRAVARERSRVIGGPTRKVAPAVAIEKTESYHDVLCALALFAPRYSLSAYDSLVSLLDEYPTSAGTDHLRMILNEIQTTDCFACVAEFNVRVPHRCVRQAVLRANRSAANFNEFLDTSVFQ